MPLVLTSLFEPLPEKLVALFCNAPRRTLYTDIAWFRLLASKTGLSQDRCFVAALHDASHNPLAAIVLEKRARPVLSPPTREIGSLANYYSCVFAPVVAPGAGMDVVRELVRALAKGLEGVDLFDLLPLPADPTLLASIEAGLREGGFAAARYEAFGNWYEAISDGGFEAYLERRPPELRSVLRRKRRKADRQGVTFEISSGSEGLEGAAAAYEAVYRTSWKGGEPHEEFMPALIRLAAARGILRIGLCFADGQPIAAQVWLVEDRRATIYKLAHDQRWSRLSIGSLLTAEVMRHVIERDRAAEVDFGRGDDPFKQMWLSQRRVRWGILAASNSTWRGLVARLRHITLPRVAGRLLKRQRPTEAAREGWSPS